MEQSRLGRRKVVGGGVCGAAGMEEFSKVCFLAELLQNTTPGFNLAELGLFAESWAFVCSLLCLDWELCGFSALVGIAASRSNLDYPFFHRRCTGEAISASWAHPGCSAGFPCALQGLFLGFPFLLPFFPLFSMAHSEHGIACRQGCNAQIGVEDLCSAEVMDVTWVRFL